MSSRFRFAAIAAAVIIAVASHLLLRAGAQSPNVAQVAKAGGRFEFEVVESFDARYVGDTPGHVGRHGELGELRPHVALGDPVQRGEQRVGTVTGLTWSAAHGSLEVEFDPEPLTRIAVGEVVWIRLGDGSK